MTEISEVAHLLSSLGRSATANEIASLLKVDRSSVNSALYKGVGTHFLKSQDYRPKWSLIRTGTSVPTKVSFPEFEGVTFHIDQDGGDWSAQIQLVSESRNDPPFRVEMVGIRRARVLLNATLIPAEDNSETVPRSSIFTMAAVALTQQISLSRGPNSSFDFAHVLGRVLLSFQAQGLRNRPTDPST